MKPIQNVFARYEKKYILPPDRFYAFLELVGPHVRPDAYGHSSIYNIYFDTPDRRLIRASLEKPVYKEKLRLRSYEIPSAESTVFIELKKKYKGVVYKRRVSMPYRDAYAYLYENTAPAQAEEQILREIEYFRSFYSPVRPAMAISYERDSFSGREDGALRITIDSALRFREDRLLLTEGGTGAPLFEEDLRLLEIKVPGAFPVWLAHILDTLRLFPVSCSKYGTAYLDAAAAGETRPPEREAGGVRYAG